MRREGIFGQHFCLSMQVRQCCPDRGEPPWASTMSDRAQPIRPLELPRLGSAGRKCTHSYAFVLDCYSNPEQIPTYARTSVQHSQRIGIKADLIGCARSLTVGAQGGRRGPYRIVKSLFTLV